MPCDQRKLRGPLQADSKFPARIGSDKECNLLPAKIAHFASHRPHDGYPPDARSERSHLQKAAREAVLHP